MSKKNKIDIDKEIRDCEIRLAVLRTAKEEKELKNNVIETRFDNLPIGIENIVAHLCIREREKVVVVFDSLSKNFCIEYASAVGEYFEFDYLGRGKVLGEVTGFIAIQKIANESPKDFLNYFGCVFEPVGKDMYKVEPFQIDKTTGKIYIEGFE